jgi:hypothetical protein
MRAMVLAAVGWFVSLQALAHASSDAFIQLRSVEGSPAEQRLRIDVALRDLDREWALDADGNGAITWGELSTRWREIEAGVESDVRLQRGGDACRVTARREPRLDDHAGQAYAVFEHTLRCTAAQGARAITYKLFAATDASHRGLMRVHTDGDERAVLLVPAAGTQPIDGVRHARDDDRGRDGGDGGDETSAAHARPDGFAGFVAEGARHIAAGLDHLLFLLTLLLVAVFRRTGVTRGAVTASDWTPQPTWRAVAVETLRVVTAFTVAHSITLGLTAAGVVAPSSRWVEAAIAASVAVAAIDNLRRIVVVLPRWALAGLFGFVHGFGFAGPMQELGLHGSQLLVPLFGFNLGVELGQLAFVALALPLLLAMRHTTAYRQRLMPAASIAIAMLALVWVVERAFDVALLST